MFAKIKNKEIIAWPYDDAAIRADNPDTSFPLGMMDVDLEQFGAVKVRQLPYPEIDHTQSAIQTDPKIVDGEWICGWDVVDATELEVAERINARWGMIRDLRDNHLAACDWTQLPDAPLYGELKAQWVEYRQALRDITEQADPFNIEWPIAPQ